MTATETPDNTDIDELAAETVAERLFELFTGAAPSGLIDIVTIRDSTRAPTGRSLS